MTAALIMGLDNNRVSLASERQALPWAWWIGLAEIAREALDLCNVRMDLTKGMEWVPHDDTPLLDNEAQTRRCRTISRHA